MDNPALTVSLLVTSALLFGRCWSPPAQQASKDVHKNKEAGITPTVVMLYMRLLQYPFWIWNLAWIGMITLQQFGPRDVVEAICPRASLPEPSGTAASFSDLSPSALAGFALLILGCFVRLWAFRELGVHFTFVVVIREKHELVKTGPYAWVRHPSYSAFFLMWPGILLAYMNPTSPSATNMIYGFLWAGGALLAPNVSSPTLTGYARLAAIWLFRPLMAGFLWAFAVVGNPIGRMARIRHEEEILHKAFGDEWVKYAERTKTLVPGLF